MKKFINFLLFFVLIGLIACNEKEDIKEDDDQVTYFKSKEEKKKDLPFSDAVQIGNILLLSGQIGMDHNTRTLVAGGIEAETNQVFKNIEAVLISHGSSLNQIVKATVILAKIEDFAAMNVVYKKHFKEHFPVRTTFAANLVAGASIEIEVIATID